MIASDDKVAIVLHGEPDPDSLAAGWALKVLLTPFAQSVRILATQPVERLQNLRLLRSLKIPVEFMDEIQWQEFTKFAVVDAQPDFFNPSLPVPFDIVIDHHPKRSNYSFKFSDVRPEYGSTATMMLEYLLLAGRKVSKKLRTALWYGLKTDTDNISTAVRPADVAAYGYLYHNSDRALIQWLEASEIPMAYREYFIKGLELLEPKDKQLLVYLGDIIKSDVCVQLADFLSLFIGLRWVAVAGICNEMVYIILRSGAYGVDVGRVAKRAFNAYGSAGGHKDKARAEIPIETMKKENKQGMTEEAIQTWLHMQLTGKGRKTSKKNHNNKQVILT